VVRHVCFAFALLAVVIVLAGCGGGGPDLVPVKGKVTYKGQPLSGASVTFHPATGPLATGTTDASGVRYQLSRAYQRLGQPERAQEQVRAMEELRTAWERFTELHRQAIRDPDDVETRYLLGIVARQLDEPDLARTWLTAALGMNPGHAAARKALQELTTGTVTRTPKPEVPNSKHIQNPKLE